MKRNKSQEIKGSCYMDTEYPDELDRALHELGMLSAVTDARREYLKETNSEYCMMRLNARYVSDVTVGYCMKRSIVKRRLCPYVLPLRHRTKSENSDAVNHEFPEISQDSKALLDPSTSSRVVLDNISQKRCQSLENLNLSTDSDSVLETSQDMDRVSTQIQKLQVDE